MPKMPLICLVLLLGSGPVAAQGFRGDVHAGLDSLHADGDSQQGVTYGLSLSYDLARSGTLLGVQTDLDATDNRSCESGVLVAGDRACIAGKRDTALSLRLGRAIGGTATVLATVGYANARLEARYEGAGIRTTDHETLNGIRLGVQLAADIGRRLYAKIEYRYTNYEQGVSRNQGLAGLGLRF